MGGPYRENGDIKLSRVGTFTLIRNESRWIRAHLLSWLPFVDEQVFFDGNSTDGTLEIIEDIAKNHPFGKRIKLFKNRDCADLDSSYQLVFNDCLRSLTTDYAIFAHPDMILDDPGNIGFLGDAASYTSSMRSFAGEPDGQLYEIKTGRAESWKNVYRLHNPDLGLHYYGAYGSDNEDCYFSKITGNEHRYRGEDYSSYPYEVKDSGIKISHFSDVRTRERRIDRMVKCLRNQGKSAEEAALIAQIHPRVTFQKAYGFTFEPCDYPAHLKGEAFV